MCELLIGSLYGSGRPLMDIPHLVTLYQAGELKLRERKELSGKRKEQGAKRSARKSTLCPLLLALSALAAGEGARGIIRW